ncbi:MAG: Alpha/beta hydrolase family protein [Planctomycetaceae bacterium]|nr:Alpha/beta hydrolase family protein [Planctomycetaceae bacterium]
MWPKLWNSRRRFFKIACFGLGLLFLAWFGISLLAAYSLLTRARSRFVETVPQSPKFDVEEFQLTTSDGETIGSWYIPGKPNFPAVILIHGNGGHRATRWPQAVLIQRAGFSVLLISCRAHGDSTGDWNDVGYSARHDVIAAVHWLKRQNRERPIVVWGASLGSAAAVFAMEDLKSDIQGLILECPYRDLDTAVWHRMQTYLPHILDRIGYWGIRLAGGIFLPHLSKISPLRAVSTIPDSVPVLILAGAADHRARPEEARELHERIANHSQIEIFEDADHLKLFEASPEQYKMIVLKFLRERVLD